MPFLLLIRFRLLCYVIASRMLLQFYLKNRMILMNMFDAILLDWCFWSFRVKNKITESFLQRQLVNVKRWKTKAKNLKTNRKMNHAIPGLSMAILISFSDGRRNFWNRRVGSGVKDLNLIETAIPRPAGLLGDKQSDHYEHSKFCY